MVKRLYLVITAAELEPALEPLLATKTDYEVIVKTVDWIRQNVSGTDDAAKIRSFVLAQAARRTGCLLLVGDYDQVPGYPIPWRDLLMRSDNYYSMPSDGEFPLLATGRLSPQKPIRPGPKTDQLANLARIVEAIVGYRALDDHRPSWLGRVILAGWLPRGIDAVDAGVVDSDAGLECLSEIGEYFEIIKRFENRNSVAYNKSNDPMGHGPMRNVFWGMTGKERISDLVEAIESGAAIIRYLGHGSENSWSNVGCHPDSPNPPHPGWDGTFLVSHIAGLDLPRGQLPLVISAACKSGAIKPMLSFAEAWQNCIKAVGVFAADVSAETFWDDRITQRIFQRIVEKGERRIGDVLLNAMKQLHDDYPREANFTQVKNYRYLGDPDTMLYPPRKAPASAALGPDGSIQVFTSGVAGPPMLRTLHSRAGWLKWADASDHPSSGQMAVLCWEYTPTGLQRLEILFVSARDSKLMHFFWGIGGWANASTFLDDEIVSKPAAVSWGAGRLDVFAIGRDGQLKHQAFENRNWDILYTKEDLGTAATDPSAVSWGPGRLDVFSGDRSRRLLHFWYEQAASSWLSERLDDIPVAFPVAVTAQPGRLDVFGVGPDHLLKHKCFENAWYGCQTIGTEQLLDSAPAAIGRSPNRFDVFAIGLDGKLRHVFYDARWNPYRVVTAFAVKPHIEAVKVSETVIDIFVRRKRDEHLIYIRYDGNGYTQKDITRNIVSECYRGPFGW